MVSGPDGIAVSMASEAAAETGSKLIENAAEATDKEKSGVIEPENDAAE